MLKEASKEGGREEVKENRAKTSEGRVRTEEEPRGRRLRNAGTEEERLYR